MKQLFSKHAFVSAINTVIASSSVLVLSSAAQASCVDQVPTLTGSSYNVFSSGSFDSNYPAWYAFDGSGSTMWLSELHETPASIGYRFSETKKVNQYTIRYTNGPSLTSRAPKEFKLQALSGSTWKTLDSQTNQTSWESGKWRTYQVANPGYYSRYRLLITDDNDDGTPGIVVISIGDLMLETCAKDELFTCSPVSDDETLCSYNGNYVSGMTFYWNSNSNFPIVYPSQGSFPYQTENGSIIFTHEGYTSCPSGTNINLATSLSEHDSFTCP